MNGSRSAVHAGTSVPVEDLENVLGRTLDFWKGHRGACVFITGATGFIGTWLLESVAHANRAATAKLQVVALTRNRAAFSRCFPHLDEQAGIRFIEGDVRQFSFPTETPDFIIHGAAESDARRNAADPDNMVDVIVSGTRRVLRLAEEAKARTLLIGSGAVYGHQPADLACISESYGGAPPVNAGSSFVLYAESKRLMEMLAQNSCEKGVAAVIARCFAFLGPHLPLDRHFAAGNFLADAIAGRPISVEGDGRAFRSYMHPLDLTVWLWTLLFKAEMGQAYNVGSDQAVSIGDLAHLVADRAGMPGNVEIHGKPSISPPARYVPDTSLAAGDLGVRMEVGLCESIDRTLAWLRTEREARRHA